MSRVAAILLAAGLSSRMGRPKPLLPWRGEPLVAWQVRQLRDAGVDEVIVVTGHAADVVAPVAVAAGARIAHNPGYAEGRAGSVRVGAATVSADVDAVVLLNVDQPRRAEISRLLIDAHLRGKERITVPSFAGRRGHPAILSGSLLSELQAVDEASEGLRAVMLRHAEERAELPFATEEVLLDVNDPAAYAAAVAAQR